MSNHTVSCFYRTNMSHATLDSLHYELSICKQCSFYYQLNNHDIHLANYEVPSVCMSEWFNVHWLIRMIIYHTNTICHHHQLFSFTFMILTHYYSVYLKILFTIAIAMTSVGVIWKLCKFNKWCFWPVCAVSALSLHLLSTRFTSNLHSCQVCHSLLAAALQKGKSTLVAGL